MTNLRSIVEATGVGVILISHLRNPQGNQKSHEEGGRVTANQLRGSGAIKHISDTIIGVERDQQGEEPNVSTFRVLKNRFVGTTGWAGQGRYSPETGRLTEYSGIKTNSDFGFSIITEESEVNELQEEETERPSGHSESIESLQDGTSSEELRGSDLAGDNKEVRAADDRGTLPVPY
jgi:hypothetical protein